MCRGVALSRGLQTAKFYDNIFGWWNQSRNLSLKNSKFSLSAQKYKMFSG